MGSFLVNDDLVNDDFLVMILNGDFMIVNDGLCIEKKEKQKKNNLPIFSFWDMVDLKCEKCGQKKNSSDFDYIFLGTIQTILINLKNNF